MGRANNTYLDFAEDDYQFFRNAIERGVMGGTLASIGQNICERYLKHIISEYADPETDMEEAEKQIVLRTHNLQRLMKYIQEDMDIEIPEETEIKLERINGFYFSTRYPGDNCFIASDRDVKKAAAAVESAREFTLDICQEFEQELEQEMEEELEEEIPKKSRSMSYSRDDEWER